MPRYDVYLDDSSDEEEESDTPYNLVENFTGFDKKYSASFFDEEDDEPRAQRYYFPFSFTCHALGISILNNKKSRELYKNSSGYVASLDKADVRLSEFKEYIEHVIDRTIYELCSQAFATSTKKSKEKSYTTIDDAYQNILTHMEKSIDDGLIENAVKNCLSDRDFYRNVSTNQAEKVLQDFNDLIDYLVLDVSNDLRSNASEGGFDDQRKLFKHWDDIASYDHIKEILMTKLVEFKPTREVLPTSCELVNKDAKSFIANILIAERSDKRRIKNLSDFDLYQTGKQETHRSWLFRQMGGYASEQSTISRNAQNRLSWIGNIEGYDDILKAINNIKNKIKEKYIISFSDRLLAQAIRANLNGGKSYLFDLSNDMLRNEREQIKELVASLTQLFFGLETTRNPSSIIINQMVLDLIIDCGFSFQQMLTREKDQDIDEFLELIYSSDQLETENDSSHILSEEEIKNCRSGGMMPMSHSGVMAVARRLEAYYQKDNAIFMPKAYNYKGSDAIAKKIHYLQTERQLIILEGKIVNTWLMREKYAEFLKAIGNVQKLTLLLESTIKDRVSAKWFKDIEIKEVTHMIMHP